MVSSFPDRLVPYGAAACLLVGTLFAGTTACAATFCVSDATELQNALTTAQSNGEDDVIKIEEGTYYAPSGGFEYAAVNFPDDDYDLEISGGWYAPFNFACLGHHNTPFQTVLDGNGSGSVMTLFVRVHSNVTVRLLTFARGGTGSTYNVAGGLKVFNTYDSQTGDGYFGTITIERNAFIENTAWADAGLYLGVFQSESTALYRVINNLFLHNHGTHGPGAAGLFIGDGNGIYLTNNTVLFNTTDDTNPDATGGIEQSGANAAQFVANNNFWGNDGFDFLMYQQGVYVDYKLIDNNYQSLGGAPPTQMAGNLSAEPEYQDPLALFDYNFTPTRNSPLVDAGANPPPISTKWYVPDTDLFGSGRRVENVDIGAYEEDVIFRDGFDPVVLP